MARYGARKYSTFKYGAQATSNLAWSIEIDWNGDGKFDGVNEARYATALQVSRGRRYLLNTTGTGFERVPDGTCSITLDDANGRYNPYNTSSPLYPNVQPGRMARVRVKYGAIVYPIFAGRVADIKPASGKDKHVTLSLVDGMRWLADTSASVSIQQNITVSEAIQLVLDAASWPVQWGTRLDTAPDLLPWWWQAGSSAAVAAHELAESALGTFFIGADGAAVYRARHHSTAPVARVTQAELAKEITLPQPWEVVRNCVQIDVQPRIQRSTAQLWQLSGKLYVSAGEQAEIFAAYKYENRDVAAVNVAKPVPVDDFTANTQEDGAGADLTADFSIELYAFSQSAKLTIRNNGSSGGYITKLLVRGDAVDTPSVVSVRAEDAASQASFGTRSFTLKNAWLQSANDATSFANFLASWLAQPRAFPAVSLEARTELQFGVDLFDLLDLSITTLAISGDYHVAEIKHEWLADNGQAVRTSWKLEPVPYLGGYWQFPVQIGVGSKFGF